MNDLVSVAVVALILYTTRCFVRAPRLAHVPTVGGPSLPLLSYWGAVKFIFHAAEIIQSGYTKYKGSVFKFADFRGWFVLVCEPSLIEEIRKAPDDQLSFDEAVQELLQADYTLGPNVHRGPYHVAIVKSELTRNIANLFPEMADEIFASFDDEIRVNSRDWTKVRVLPAITQIVCRTSNRAFVGLPLCRDPEFCKLNKTFTIDVMSGGTVIGMFPDLLKPIIARFLTNVPASIQLGIRLLEPVITERLRRQNQSKDPSDHTEKPQDLLQWLIEAAPEQERTVRALVIRILTVNVGAVHTTSMCFTHALYYLAAYPQYIEVLREEVESVLRNEGWTKSAMGKLRKVDSFLKETLRLTGISARSLDRKAMKDVVLSDGTYIPAGTFVGAPLRGIHLDDAFYPNAHVFDPWRFSNMREEEGEATKHHAVTTSPQYLLFGHGKHACPGRFFAVNELKAMLAHVVMTYDIKMEREGEIPSSSWLAHSLVPNTTADVLFRKRAPS